MFGFSITAWAAGGLLIGMFAFGSYLAGIQVGEQRGREAALERSVDILRERAKTDEQIRSLDDAALCEQLGGLPDECAAIGL